MTSHEWPGRYTTWLERMHLFNWMTTARQHSLNSRTGWPPPPFSWHRRIGHSSWSRAATGTRRSVVRYRLWELRLIAHREVLLHYTQGTSWRSVWLQEVSTASVGTDNAALTYLNEDTGAHWPTGGGWISCPNMTAILVYLLYFRGEGWILFCLCNFLFFSADHLVWGKPGGPGKMLWFLNRHSVQPLMGHGPISWISSNLDRSRQVVPPVAWQSSQVHSQEAPPRRCSLLSSACVGGSPYCRNTLVVFRLNSPVFAYPNRRMSCR